MACEVAPYETTCDNRFNTTNVVLLLCVLEPRSIFINLLETPTLLESWLKIDVKLKRKTDGKSMSIDTVFILLYFT